MRKILLSRGLGFASYISFGLERETPLGRCSITAPRSCPFACRGRLKRSLDHPRCACVTPFHRLWRAVFGDLRVPRSHIYRAREMSVVSPQFPGAHRRRRLRRLRALSVSIRLRRGM